MTGLALLRRQTRRSLCLIAGISLLLLLGSEPVAAHEIGTTQVNLALTAQGQWNAVITTAPTALVNRLQMMAGESLSTVLTADTVSSLLEAHADVLAQQVELQIDGTVLPVTIHIQKVEMPADITLPAFVELRADGTLPAGGKYAVWRYRLVYSTYALAITGPAGAEPSIQWLEGDSPSQPFPLQEAGTRASLPRLVGQYLLLGFTHIVPYGLDHILFVLGIFLLSTRLGALLTQVTAFTIAHSVTLGLTMYGVLALPPRIVEPLIALSIAYVAVENLMTTKLTPWRPAMVFCFGLLHGMGFAGVLRDLKLRREETIPALVSFNLGIELAQLAIIAAAYGLIVLSRCDKRHYRRAVVIPASCVIAATGLYWTVTRLGAN
jgi:hypothetical protein